MSHTETLRKAGAAAAVYLEMRGFTILEQNWRRPRAAIDIIATKQGVVHFVEVSYQNDIADVKTDHVTKSKLKHMHYAGDNWLQETKWHGTYSYAIVEIAGPQYSVMGFIDNAY